jgi:hypothetical protein
MLKSKNGDTHLHCSCVHISFEERCFLEDDFDISKCLSDSEETRIQGSPSIGFLPFQFF